MQEAVLGIIVGKHMVLLGEKLTGEIGKGTLNAPGGKIEPGETIYAALEREIAEELSIGIDKDFVEYAGAIVFHAAGIPYMKVPMYVSRKHIPYSYMLPSDIHWFQRFVDGGTFNANIFYREKSKGFERIQFLPFTPVDIE